MKALGVRKKKKNALNKNSDMSVSAVWLWTFVFKTVNNFYRSEGLDQWNGAFITHDAT